MGEEELIALSLKSIQINNEKRELPQLVFEHNHKFRIEYIPFEHQLVSSQLLTNQIKHQIHVEF
ncbi:hypothetical protein EV02_1546 [Prochlorococcus marinus str. SB]|uniref:Uncharacterized protein n=1 Tax=Prochlorococcus marinus str. SB TaxID=59926 RepID=A0A0A2B4R6_PROMR|nr:hypothetical protein EV02_1546 [Prochlorococcus marinus str. SB]